MQILEHGTSHEKTLLFLPCTAEPAWAFSASVELLARKWHVFQVIYDGHEPEFPGDFTSVEQPVEDILLYLNDHDVLSLDAAYGCSLGGACLARLLALDVLPVGRAIIDGGITPYRLPIPLRKLLCLRDFWGFKLLAGNRNILEAAFPPQRFTLPGHDPVKEYDAIEAYLKTYSNRTVWNVFWSANNYQLPPSPPPLSTKLIYWYGSDEKRDRRRDIRFIRQYFGCHTRGIPKMAHGELVMIHPEEFCWYAEKFLEG